MSELNISQCTVTLTRQCNLRCDFCYAKKTKYLNTATLKIDDLKRIIDFCDEAKVKYIVFTGGEPTLYARLHEALLYIKNKEHPMIPTIATNGIMLENMQYCKAIIDDGISYIDISLKGSSNKDCSDVTGIDCYSQQLAAIRNLSVLPIEFTASLVITEHNIHSFLEIVQTAYNNGAKQFSFTFMIDNEKNDDNFKEYQLKHNPFSLIEVFISKIDELNAITHDWWIEYSFPLCVYTEEQLKLLNRKLAAPCQIHIGNGITFDTQMNLIPCNMFFEDIIGQLGTDFSSYEEYKEFIKKSVYSSAITELKEYPSNQCNDCQYLKNCFGGCPVLWNNYSFEALQTLKSNYYN